MIAADSQNIDKSSFEHTFNEFYKQFLDKEKEFNDQIKTEKKLKDEKITNARKEGLELIKNYEQEQKENMEVIKGKVGSLCSK